MTVKERLILYIKSKNLSQRKFEIIVGLSNGYVNNINKSIQPDKIQKIALQFPDLNTGWLLAGEGEMLKGNSGDTQSNSDASSLMELIKSQQRTIENLSDTVKNLTNK